MAFETRERLVNFIHIPEGYFTDNGIIDRLPWWLINNHEEYGWVYVIDWSARNYTIIHYNDIIMGAMSSQITSLTIFYWTVYSDADQRKHQSSAALAFVLGIHRGPVNSPDKWPVRRKMFPFDDVIMKTYKTSVYISWDIPYKVCHILSKDINLL